MQTIQPSHEVVSVFDIASKTKALTKQPNRGLLISIVSAFLIVAVLGILLNFVQAAFNGSPAEAADRLALDDEPVAFVPGQFVSAEIHRGYIGH